MAEFLAAIDWTDVLVAIIAIIGSIATFMLKKYVVPWLDERKLTEAARVAVNAAEAIFGRYHGKEKMEAALQMLSEQGFNISTERVLNALRAAWKELDLEMMDAGAKTPENPEPSDASKTE